MSPDQFFKFSSEIFQKVIILQILNKNPRISISKSNVSKQLKNIHSNFPRIRNPRLLYTRKVQSSQDRKSDTEEGFDSGWV